jgi:hypothetical protein
MTKGRWKLCHAAATVKKGTPFRNASGGNDYPARSNSMAVTSQGAQLEDSNSVDSRNFYAASRRTALRELQILPGHGFELRHVSVYPATP